MRLKLAETVLLGALLTGGCATPARDQPAQPPAPTVALGSAGGSASAAAPNPAASPNPASPNPGSPAVPHPGSPDVTAAPAASGSARPAGPPAATGSAYFGCGEPIPLQHLWDETSESQVLEAISAAKACAAERGRRLLLEFVAPWCDDCREMARLDETPLVSETLRSRFERVRINVGKWDRHEGLRKTYDVKALAAYIVIDPKTSRQLAKTTLEPITKKRGKKLTAADWAAWLSQH